jgi:hypothetical protein
MQSRSSQFTLLCDRTQLTLSVAETPKVFLTHRMQYIWAGEDRTEKKKNSNNDSYELFSLFLFDEF